MGPSLEKPLTTESVTHTGHDLLTGEGIEDPFGFFLGRGIETAHYHHAHCRRRYADSGCGHTHHVGRDQHLDRCPGFLSELQSSAACPTGHHQST
jgi:hypothetical protein